MSLEIATTKTESDVVLSAEQSRHIKKIKAYHAACIKNVKQQMGYAFLVGLELDSLKKTLDHGQFEDVCAKSFPSIPERSLKRYKQFFTAMLELKPASGKSAIVALLTDGKAVNSKGKLTKEGQTAVLDAFYEATDGKTLTDMYRDLGVIRQPKPDGGFRPPEKEVQAWLKEHHPELAGTKFADLPEALRKQFKKQYRPALPEEITIEAKRAQTMLAAKDFATVFDDGLYAHCTEAERRELLAICKDAAKLLEGSLKNK